MVTQGGVYRSIPKKLFEKLVGDCLVNRLLIVFDGIDKMRNLPRNITCEPYHYRLAGHCNDKDYNPHR